MLDVLTVHDFTTILWSAPYLVTVNSEGTKVAESLADGALPTSNPSSEANNEWASQWIILHTL